MLSVRKSAMPFSQYDGKHRAFTLHCGAGAQVLETWQKAQLEPNTLIEAESLSANAKARAEALQLATFELEEEEGKLVITY
jgi:hypothetical protein